MTNQSSCEWKTAAQFAGSLRGALALVGDAGLGLRGWRRAWKWGRSRIRACTIIDR
ncbi:MAG: hypothetical protein O8C67_02345 [Candidatus Methanoperedens sp.]|nr:hypothetical protein [Candidatus Methanoperedens sp.]